MLSKAGFEVPAFDADDQSGVLDCFEKLTYAQAKPRAERVKDYFCWYAIVR